MKIVVLSSHTPSLFWFRLDMMLEFIKAGHSVVAVGHDRDPKWSQMLSQYGISYRHIKVDRNGTSPLRDLHTFSDIYKILKKEKPDKIFTYQAKPVIYGCIAAKLLKINEIYPLIAGVGSILLSSRNTLLKKIVKAEYKFALKFAKKIFFQNTSDIDEYVNQSIIRKDQAVIINGSGVNLDKFTPSPLVQRPVFLFVGRLIRDKGIFEYLESSRKLRAEFPEARFMLVGPFDSNPSAITRQTLEPYIQDGTVEYYGETLSVKKYLDMCSVFVLPSYREGTPKSVLEALACGRPVITTDAPGCRETVTDGFNGLIVEPKNEASLYEKMKLLIQDFELVKHLASNARKSAEDKYDVKMVNAEILKAMNI